MFKTALVAVIIFLLAIISAMTGAGLARAQLIESMRIGADLRDAHIQVITEELELTKEANWILREQLDNYDCWDEESMSYASMHIGI